MQELTDNSCWPKVKCPAWNYPDNEKSIPGSYVTPSLTFGISDSSRFYNEKDQNIAKNSIAAKTLSWWKKFHLLTMQHKAETWVNTKYTLPWNILILLNITDN